jgi:hypothetical protein
MLAPGWMSAGLDVWPWPDAPEVGSVYRRYAFGLTDVAPRFA